MGAEGMRGPGVRGGGVELMKRGRKMAGIGKNGERTG